MALFEQEVNKKIKKKNRLSSDEKKALKEMKRKNKEREKQVKRNEKIIKKNNKKGINKRKDNTFSTIDGFKYTLSYIESNNRYGSILQLENKYGTNRNMQYGWVINLIPESNIDGIKIWFITKDKLVSEETQNKIIRDKAEAVINASEEQGNVLSKENEGDMKLKEMRAKDFKRAQVRDAIENKETIVDFEIYCVITADNPDKIVQQIENINTLYNERNKGIEITSVAGKQQKMFEEIFNPVKGDVNTFNLMSGDYAGNDHMVRKGLNDVEHAIPIGILTETYAKGIANMSINKRFKDDLLIAAPMSDVIDEEHYEKNVSASSTWGQLVANDVMTHGNKVFHIVMNGFHYEPDYDGWIEIGEDEYGTPEYVWNEFYKKHPKYVCEPIVGEEMSHYNLLKGGINPLQIYGDQARENASQVFSKHIQKVTYMNYLMSKRKMNDSETRNLRKLLLSFYEDRDLWSDEADINPYAARIFGLDPVTVPTLSDFILKLKNFEIEAHTGRGTDNLKEIASSLYDILDVSLSMNRQVFDTYSTLPEPKDITTLQNYYDLSYFDDKDVMEAEFLNIFGYITHAAQKNDVVMIHGVDNLSLEVLDLIRDDINRLKRKGTRMAYLFDRIGSGEIQKTTKNYLERADVFNTNGYLYSNLERDFSITIFGTMTSDELIKYEKGVKQKLTEKMRSDLTNTEVRNQYQIRSGERTGKSTVMVSAYFII